MTISWFAKTFDDHSENPERWSPRKLADEMARLKQWLLSATLTERERFAIERVLDRIAAVAANRHAG